MSAHPPTKKKVLTIIQDNQDKIKTFGVKKLGLFGSFARQEQNVKSDVDLLVEFEQGKKTFDNFIQLSFLLEDLFNRRVELVTPEALNPYIGPHILKEVEYVSFSS
jgi:predicted nucleotidyltransferase